MKKILIFLLLVILNAESFEEYKQNQLKSFYDYKTSLQKAFKEYKEELNKEFEHYKKTLSTYWKKPELTTKKKFVEYSKDKKIRKKVDYSKETITIDVIAKNKKEAIKKIKKALLELSTETTKDAVYKNPVLKKIKNKLVKKYKNLSVITKPSKEPIIADMVFNGKPTRSKVKKFVNKALKNPLQIANSKIKNEKVYSLSVKLPPNSILKKAKYYKYDVFKRANQFVLTPSLIYAIIHTESSFNPLARSYVPAFGLMQIVPHTAGKDAYKMLYKKEKILTPNYLYNSHNNILIGSAYLKLLYYHYFKRIKNPLSRLYCTIAAYNTGAGNVSCAFNSREKRGGRTVCRRSRGDYSVAKAIPIINSMSSKEVYNHLIKNLRYDEAKNYLKRVKLRYKMYLKALKSRQL